MPTSLKHKEMGGVQRQRMSRIVRDEIGIQLQSVWDKRRTLDFIVYATGDRLTFAYFNINIVVLKKKIRGS